MLNQFSRTQLLLGKEAMDKLANSRVAVFGIGGVGGYVCEALVRSGVGEFDQIDDDKVCLTNLNRQIIATMIVTPSFTMSAVSNFGHPAATMMISAVRQIDFRSRVLE